MKRQKFERADKKNPAHDIALQYGCVVCDRKRIRDGVVVEEDCLYCEACIRKLAAALEKAGKK